MMTFEERIKKYNYIKVLHNYSSVTKGRIYKIQDIKEWDFRDEIRYKIYIRRDRNTGNFQNTHFNSFDVNNCFIFVTDKYAEERGYHG